MPSTGFFAYPEGFPIVEQAITAAVEETAASALRLKPWKQMQIVGFKVDDVVRAQIDDAAVLVADITYPNANVYYEIGFAMARGKPVLPTICSAIDRAISGVQKTGIFDTIGWAVYANSAELISKLEHWPDISWTSKYVRRRNYGQPLFILDTLSKTDFRNQIFSAVENSCVKYRSFDPAQIPRLTAAQAVADVSSSAGAIVPLIADEIVDFHLHSLRASFVIGLCHGFDVEVLAIQYDGRPVALDFRDFVRNSNRKAETERHVETFASEVLIWNQKASSRENIGTLGLLADIDLGSPTAENETQKLSYYFVRTAEFARALRAESAVITGRKGAGKSAVFLQIAEVTSRNKGSCIVDLRPASHNLSEMREAILSVVTSGVFDHTVAAFWQYIMYIEIILKLREAALLRARNDFKIQERVRQLEEIASLDESIVSADFTSRLAKAVEEVIAATTRAEGGGDIRQKLTNFMFEEPIPRLRDAVVSFSDFAEEVVLLIDDLDKGWPPKQVEGQDVVMIKHLIEVLNRIQRDLRKRKVTLRHLIFLRSDIYEQLVEETSDRGKYNIIKVDWSDPEQLRHLLRQRVVSRLDATQQEAGWDSINPQMPSGRDAIGEMIDGSLRRPRFLIDLCERTLAFAINRGHGLVTPEDVEEGLRQMSLYLVSDFGYEMRDVAGTPQDIFFPFIGKPDMLTEQELEEILSRSAFGFSLDDTVDLLLWYGFLGVLRDSGTPVFIYDLAYDFRRLLAERSAQRSERLYSVNPAFLRGLERDLHA